MAEIRQEMPAGNLGVAEATRIFAAHPNAPLSREAAAEVLAKHGILPPGTDGRPVYSIAPSDPTAADYRIETRDLKLPDGADPAEIANGAAEMAAALRLPQYMAAPLMRQIAEAEEVDPAAVQKVVETAGHDYAGLVRDVDALLVDGARRFNGEGWNIKAADLPAPVLVQLAIFARHTNSRRS